MSIFIKCRGQKNTLNNSANAKSAQCRLGKLYPSHPTSSTDGQDLRGIEEGFTSGTENSKTHRVFVYLVLNLDPPACCINLLLLNYN